MAGVLNIERVDALSDVVESGETVYFQGEVLNMGRGAMNATLRFELGGSEIARGTQEIASGETATFQHQLTWSDLKNEVGTGTFRLSAHTDYDSLTGEEVTIKSQIDPSNVYVRSGSCGATNSSISDGETTRFTAQVANDNPVEVEAFVQWNIVNVGEIEGVIERIPSGGGSVDTGPKTYNQLESLAGKGETGFQAEVVDVYPVGSYT